MNQLKASIYKALPPNGYEMHDVERAQVARDILDTLLSALPEEQNSKLVGVSSFMPTGYNAAIQTVKQLLLNAKEDK